MVTPTCTLTTIAPGCTPTLECSPHNQSGEAMCPWNLHRLPIRLSPGETLPRQQATATPSPHPFSHNLAIPSILTPANHHPTGHQLFTNCSPDTDLTNPRNPRNAVHSLASTGRPVAKRLRDTWRRRRRHRPRPGGGRRTASSEDEKKKMLGVICLDL